MMPHGATAYVAAILLTSPLQVHSRTLRGAWLEVSIGSANFSVSDFGASGGLTAAHLHDSKTAPGTRFSPTHCR